VSQGTGSAVLGGACPTSRLPPAVAAAFASALLARLHAQSRLAQKLAPSRPMVERSVEQSVPPAESGPHDFAVSRLSRALMHAAAAAGGVRGRNGAQQEFVEVDAMPRLSLIIRKHYR
jgi:hypothetical protein